jgi:ssDNA-binding replication factor A large subunit
MLAARDHGVSRCGRVSIELRLRGVASSTYMFSVEGRPVAQADIPDHSVRELKNLQNELSRYINTVEEHRDSNKLDANYERRISDLRSGLKGVCFKAIVTRKSDVRAVTSRFGVPLLICSVTLSDGTGEIPLTLWNNQTATIFKGDRVQVRDARVRNFRGATQLSLGRKTGQLIVLESGTKAPITGISN